MAKRVKGVFMNFRCLRVLGLVAALATVSACASREYSAEPIDIKIVDAETKKPVEGALVIARWVAKGGGVFHGPHAVGNVEILETITGPDGKIHFPASGPIRYPGKGVLLDEDPLILIFKRGYMTRELDNTQYGVPSSKDYRSHKGGPVRASLWNGEVAEMKPFKGELKEFVGNYYDSLNRDLRNSFFSESSTPCNWKKIPKTIAYLEREKKAYFELGVQKDVGGPSSLLDDLASNDENFVAKGCGSPRQFYKDVWP